jgi:hypothetical protein
MNLLKTCGIRDNARVITNAYTYPSIYEFSLQRTMQIYTRFSVYEHYFLYNEEPTFARGPSSRILSNERGEFSSTQRMENARLTHFPQPSINLLISYH